MEKIGLEAILKDQQFRAGLKRYLAGLDRMERETDRVAQSTAAKFIVSGAKISAAVAGIGVAVVAAGTALAIREVTQELGELVKRGMEIEGVRAAFMAAGGDMTSVLEAYREATAGMVEDTELMRNYNLAAQLISETFARDLPRAMQYLRKVSAATGQSMSYLLDSLIRGVGRLSPLILDNLAVQIDMTAAMERYAAAIGKDASELSKLEQQTAVFNEVMRQLERNTAAMPDVVGTNIQRWQSFQTTVRNVKDEIAMRLMPVVVQVGEAVLPQLASAITAIGDRIGQSVSEWGEVVGASLATIIEDVGDVIQAWIALRTETSKEFNVQPIQSISDQLVQTTKDILTFAENVRHARVMVSLWVGGLVSGVVAQIRAIRDEIKEVIDSIIALADAVVTASAAANQALLFNFDEAARLWDEARAKFAALPTDMQFDPVEAAMKAALEHTSAMNEELEAEKALHAENLALIEAQNSELKDKVEEIRETRTMLERLNAAMAGLEGYEAEMRAMGLLPSAPGAEGGVVEVPVAPKLDSEAQSAFERAWNSMVDRAKSYLEAGISASRGLFDFVPDIFQPGANGPFENIYRAQAVAVGGDADQWASVLGLDQATAQEIVRKFQQGIIDEQVKAFIDMPALAEAARTAALGEQMKTAFAEEVARQAGVGTDVVSSLLGMKDPNLPTRIASDVSQIASQAAAAAQAQGEMMASAGKSLMSALIRGLESMRSDVLLTVDSIARAMLATMRAVLGGGASAPVQPPAKGGGAEGQTNNVRNTFYNVQVHVPVGTAAEVRRAAGDGVLAAFKAMGVA